MSDQEWDQDKHGPSPEETSHAYPYVEWQEGYEEEAPADGAEPDRAAEFERARRAALTRERLEGASGEVRPDE